MAKQVKDVYGNALFELALEEDHIDDYLAEAEAVLVALEENPELTAMMTHPQISEEEKHSVLEAIFQGRVSDEIYALLCMIQQKGHFADTASVFAYFADRVKENRHIGVVYVLTPMPLSDAQEQAIAEKLLDTTDYVSLEMHFGVEEELIGGMVIRIGDRVVDSSVRTKLEKLSQALSA